MNIGIYTNCNKDKDLTVTKKLVNILHRANIDVFLHSDLAEYEIGDKYFSETSEKLFNILLTVGGDGTILRIAGYCARNQIAILGVNLGTVGFLTEIELACLDRIPEILKSGELRQETRSLLCVKLNDKDYYALNEIVVSRHNADRMIALAVHINGRLADKYYCDGYIVSTPTGSTAYSLSAGGSVISPTAKAFCLVPINSHSLHSRPIIVDDNDKISLSLLGNRDGCVVIADGQPVGEVKADKPLDICKADRELIFLRLKDSNFFEKLLSKLNTWSVTLK